MTDLLAIGPHPDDIELAASGTLSLFRAAGKRVVLLDLTRGERATRGNPSTRADEALDAARILGVEREGLDLPDGGLNAREPEQLEQLVEVIRRLRPRLIVGMHWNDDHPDHIEAADLVRRAAYWSGVRNYPEPAGDSFRCERLLFAMGRRPFVPSLIVDVTSSYETKRRAIRAFKTQFHRDPDDPLSTPISDPGFLEWIEARDRYFGGMIGSTYGEPFFELGPHPVRGIETLIEEGRP